jgi:hypothetical protein
MGCDALGVGAVDPLDEALEAKPSEVVALLCRAVVVERTTIWARRDLWVSPPITWAKAAIEPSSAIVRGSPKRSPGARWRATSLVMTSVEKPGGLVLAAVDDARLTTSETRSRRPGSRCPAIAASSRRGRAGSSKTAVSETSSWATEKDRSNPARRSHGERVGHDRGHPRKKVAHVAGTETRADAMGGRFVGDATRPLEGRLGEPAFSSGRSAHSCPSPRRSGIGRVRESATKAGPHCRSAKQR